MTLWRTGQDISLTPDLKSTLTDDTAIFTQDQETTHDNAEIASFYQWKLMEGAVRARGQSRVPPFD